MARTRARRSGRNGVSVTDRPAILADLERGRDAAIKVITRSRIGGEAYRAATAANEAIAAVIERLQEPGSDQ